MFQRLGTIIQYTSSVFRIRLFGVKNIPDALLLIFLTIQLVSPLAGIQCFHCKDIMSQEFGPNSSTSGKHRDDCGTLKLTGRLECPGAQLCSKITVYYQHNSTSEVKQVIQRSCWTTTEKIRISGRNYSSGNCYRDIVSSRPHTIQVCVCDKDYCNSEESQIPAVSPIQIIANLLLAHFCWHPMFS